MYAKHTIWGKETFPETSPFTVYEHVRCQEAKNQGKHHIGEIRILQKIFISVLMSYLHTKTLKRIQNALEKLNNITKKACIFSVLSVLRKKKVTNDNMRNLYKQRF